MSKRAPPNPLDDFIFNFSDSDSEEYTITTKNPSICRPIKIRRIVPPTPEKAPNVETLEDLIKLAERAEKENVAYTNIDTYMLKNVKPQLIELQELVEMDELKKSLMDQIIYYLKGFHKNSNDEYLHMCLMGPPGCGKSTSAEIIARFYSNAGILSKKGVFKRATPADLVGKYVGHTVPQTKEFLESCLGGVAFLDEAYNLGNNANGRATSFSRESINFINQFLSEHKKDFCLIIAGYEKELKRDFFSINPGLKRRFWMHTIKKNTPFGLSKIFEKKVKDKNWKLNVELKVVEKLIKDNEHLFKFQGGSIERWLTKIKIKHARRVFPLDKEEMYVISKEDLEAGIEELGKHADKPLPPPPFGMYT